MNLTGTEITRQQAELLVGDASQLGEVTLSTIDEGPGRGCRVAGVRSAGGFCFDVLLDRCLDIGWTSVDGTPLGWRSPLGLGARTGAGDRAWAEAFGGGLLTTCGLSSIGRASTDRGTRYGLHGRVALLPAREIATTASWEGDDYVLTVSGRVVETDVFDTTLELARTVSTVVGEPRLTVRDVVTNLGPAPAPVMLRHHLTLGYPLVRAGDRIVVDAGLPRSRDPVGPEALARWDLLAPVGGDVEEEVYCATVRADRDWARAELVDGTSGSSKFTLDWDARTMPQLVVWKHQHHRVNALGVEPSTHDDHGRAAAHQAGSLDELEPGASRTFTTRISVGPDATPTDRQERSAR